MAVLLPYHGALLELLQAQPGRGRGHAWLFRVALHLRHYHTAEACFRLLRACADTWKDRLVPDPEIRAAVAKAYDANPDETAEPSAAPWPPPDPAAIACVLAQTEPLFGFQPLELSAQRILSALFRFDELVCAAFAQGGAHTVTLRERFADADRCQFVVPSPMSARTGMNQQGVESARCLANTGPRRYLVIESDAATKEEQARLLSHLAMILPLALVVDSGGKSLHGWYWAHGQTEPALRLFMAYAVRLGADPHTWVRCQWVRMPGGTRYPDDAPPRPQPLLYVHPHLLAEVSA